MRLSPSLLALAAIVAAAAPAAAATRDFPVDSFDRVRSTGPFDVRVHTGAPASAHATGDQALLDRISVTVRDGELRVGGTPGGWMSGWSWGGRRPMVVEVTVPMLRAVALTGSGDLTIDRVRTRSFGAAVTGSGDLNLPMVDAGEIALTLGGSGDLTAAGRAGHARVAGHGSGDLDAGKLVAQTADVELAGSGDVTLGATSTATVTLRGSGDAAITGGARCTTIRHGSGDIRCR